MRKFNSRKITVALLVLSAGFCFWQALPRTVSHDAAQILSPTATADITLTSASPSAIRTQTIESIKVGQRVLAKNPEISNFERRTRRAEPDFGRWLQLSLEMPKPDGSTLTIQMLRSEEWLRNQIGFVITENSDDELTITNEASQRNTALNFSSPLASSSSPLAPLSPLRPIFSDILFTSLAAEADGAELVGLTVQLDLPELGLTGEAILTEIQTTPEIEAPNDHRDERQVVTATFHHSSGDVIDLVVADSRSSLPGRTFAEGEPYALDAADSSTVDSSGTADESQVAASREVLLGKEDLQANRTATGSDQEELNTENRTRKTHDDAETIGTTSNHPFWSVDRSEYVQAGSLRIGERLQTLHGNTKTVVAIQKLPRSGPQPVFNLEVHDEHVYFVGEDGVLVHNAYDVSDAAARRAYLNQKFGRTGNFDADINARGGLTVASRESAAFSSVKSVRRQVENVMAADPNMQRLLANGDTMTYGFVFDARMKRRLGVSNGGTSMIPGLEGTHAVIKDGGKFGVRGDYRMPDLRDRNEAGTISGYWDIKPSSFTWNQPFQDIQRWTGITPRRIGYNR